MIGTRARALRSQNHPEQGVPNSVPTRDLGMAKLVTAVVSTVPASGQFTAAAGTFTPFAANDEIEVVGGVRGFFSVNVVAPDGSSITVDRPPPAAAGVTCTFRAC